MMQGVEYQINNGQMRVDLLAWYMHSLAGSAPIDQAWGCESCFITSSLSADNLVDV